MHRYNYYVYIPTCEYDIMSAMFVLYTLYKHGVIFPCAKICQMSKTTDLTYRVFTWQTDCN